jgi:DNA-binding beta-propeller fold protein YncE
MSGYRRVCVLALAFLAAGCGAQAVAPRASSTPAPSPSASETPRPTNAARDIVYLRSNGGPSAAILAIDARTGETLRTLHDGAITADAATVYWPESVSGGTKTTIHVSDLATGKENQAFTVDGDLRPAGNPETFSPLTGDGRLTRDGRSLALMSAPYKLDGEWITRLVIANTVTGTIESAAEFRGQTTYGFITFSPDGRSAFLEQYGDGATRTRAFDVASRKLLDLSGAGLTTTGFRTAAVLSPDGRWLFRIDSGAQTTNCTSTDGPSCTPNGTPPFVVAVDLVARRATQIMLPATQLSDDFEKYMLWSLSITPDGATLFAVNPALGVIDEIDARQLRLRRTAQIPVARAGDDMLAAVWRALLPVADAKRYLIGGAVLSPDGATLYAAAHAGVVAIDTASLTSRAASWQRTHQFDTLRLTSDGRRLYAMDNLAGTLVIIDTSSGASLGEVKLRYAPAILRIDPA